MKPQLVAGIEIEAETNHALLPIDKIGGRHECNFPVWFNHDFVMESDGSISHTKFSNYKCIEFISKPVPLKVFKMLLKGFEAEIINKSSNKNLSDVLNFNRSTGSHIHFTFLNVENPNKISRYAFKDKQIMMDGTPINLKYVISPKILNHINMKIMKAVDKHLPVPTASAFKRQFYRSHAQKMIDDDLPLYYDERKTSWNLSLSQKNRLEFRSMNLCGVDNWRDFHKLILLVLKICNVEFTKLVKHPEKMYVEKEQIIQMEQPHRHINFAIEV